MHWFSLNSFTIKFILRNENERKHRSDYNEAPAMNRSKWFWSSMSTASLFSPDSWSSRLLNRRRSTLFAMGGISAYGMLSESRYSLICEILHWSWSFRLMICCCCFSFLLLRRCLLRRSSAARLLGEDWGGLSWSDAVVDASAGVLLSMCATKAQKCHFSSMPMYLNSRRKIPPSDICWRILAITHYSVTKARSNFSRERLEATASNSPRSCSQLISTLIGGNTRWKPVWTSIDLFLAIEMTNSLFCGSD